MFIALLLIQSRSNQGKCQYVSSASHQKRKEKGTCISEVTGTALVILMLQKTTFLRCTAGESVRSRSQDHLQPASAQQTWGSKPNPEKAEVQRVWLPGCSSLLLTAKPVFYCCVQVQRLHCLSWLSRFHSHFLSAGDRKCDLGSSGSARCKKKKYKSSVLEGHGRQNQRAKAWLQRSQRDADICACQSFFSWQQ